MKTIIILIILFIGVDSAYAQKFKVTRDTIVMNPSWLTPDSPRCEVQKVVEYHNDYYCLCKIVIPSDTFYMRYIVETPIYYPKRELFYYMMRIDGKDKSMHPIMLPDKMRAIPNFCPSTMFVRRDSLILKWERSHSDHLYNSMFYDTDEEEENDYCWDEEHHTWVETKPANDDHYEDSRWLVTKYAILNGSYTLFTNKKTGKRFIYNGIPSRYLRKGDSFYLIRDAFIRKIDNVNDGIEYQGGDIAELKDNKQYSNSQKIFTIERDSTQKLLSYTWTEEDMRTGTGNNLLTGWFIGNQMYVVVTSRQGEYIARYDNGELTKVLDLGFNCRPMLYSSPQANFLPNHKAIWRYFDYDTHNIIYLSINRWKIHITYFINNYENVETDDWYIKSW